MSDSPGTIIEASEALLSPTNRSPNVTAAVALANTESVSIGAHPFAVNHGIPQPAISIAHRSVSGRKQEVFGGQLFEKLIVIPRVKKLGFVLSGTQFAVEVWNAFRDSDQKLQTITVAGVGGLTLANPFGLPLLFAGLDSYIFQATVSGAGVAQIAQQILFGFLSGLSGTECDITGSRITLFSVGPQWSEGMEESIEYLTDVLRSYSDNEQRRGLRQIPRRALRFRALTLNARDAAGMESLVWGWQNQPYGVPWWPDAQPLLSDVAIGSFVIPVNTTDRLFAAGGLLCLWGDEFTFEAVSIESVATNSVTITSPTQFAWKGGPGTRVIPVLLCRLPNKVDVSRLSSEIDQIDLDFLGEAGQTVPTPTAASLTQFRGYDVLEVAPNWKGTLKRSYHRSMVTIDPKVGPIEVIDKGGSALVGQDFPWWLDSHSKITTFRAFIVRRFGQLNPFWIPTWDQDLVLFQDCLAADPGIRVRSEFYTRFFFPSPARRYIAFIPIDGSGNVYRTIAAASDNGDGTENLVLDSPTGKDFKKGATMVSFLTFARLAEDKVSIKWAHSELAESVLGLQEVPRELP